MKTRRNTFVGITLPLPVLLLSGVSIAGLVSDPPDQREIKAMARRFEFSPKTITIHRGERVRPSTSLLFEYTPRVGFKLGQITPEFDPKVGQLTGFKNESEAEIAFGFEKRIGRHVFSLTFSNTQTTTTARYNSSNQALPPNKFSIGFNLFRRLL